MSRDDYTDDICKALASVGGHLSIGPAGGTLHWANQWGGSSRLTGFHPDKMRDQAIALGLPVLDCSAVDLKVACDLIIRGPMVAVGEAPDAPPYNALSKAPLADVAAMYRAAGATVSNL